MKKIVALACLVLATLTGWCMEIRTQALDKKYGPFTGPVERGKWNTDFNACKQFADAHCVPMIVFWGHVGCEFCEYMITCLNLAYMNEYFDKRQMVMCFELAPSSYHVGDDDTPYPGKRWMRDNGSNSSYPLMAVYWKKPDGTVLSSFFCGARTQTSNHGACMPVREGSTDKKILEAVHKWNPRCSTTVMNNTMYMQLEGSIEQVIMDWDGSQVDETDGRFLLEKATLQAEMQPTIGAVPGQAITKSVYVPLARDIVGTEITNTLVATWSEEAQNADRTLVTNTVSATYDILWTNDIQQAYPRIDFTNAVVSDVALTLISSMGKELDTREIRIVSPQPVSQDNPLWIGERTAETLQAGEWTMDYDVALDRTARQKGAAYTVVVVGGELWCPDCKGMRANVLDTPQFNDWVKKNNIALVLIDVPKNYETCAPTYLSFNEASDGSSGAEYLSRKAVPPEQAAYYLARNRQLCYEEWNYPYEGRARLWLPTALLLRKDGSLVSKLVGDRTCPNGTTFTVEDYIRRFDEMRMLAEDPGEFENNDWTTTRDELSAVSGTSFEGSLSAVDGRISGATFGNVLDYVRLLDVQPGFEVTATIEATGDDAAVAFQVLEVGATTSVVASAAVQLAEGASVSAVAKAGYAYYLKVAGNDPGGVFSYSNDVSTVRGYRLKASSALCPAVDANTVSVKAGTVSMRVGGTSMYFIKSDKGKTSFTLGGLEDVGDDCYIVTDPSATFVTLTFNQACELTFSEWNAGEVAFGMPSRTYAEGSGACYMKLCRTGGFSGRATVRISVVDGDPETDPLVYDWPRDNQGNPLPVEYVWESGDKQDKALTNLVALSRKGYFGDYTVNLAMEVVSGTSLGAQSTCAIVITEGDEASKGRLGIVATLPSMQYGKRVVCVREGASVTNYVVRSTGFDGDIAATVSATAGILSTNRLDWYNRVTVTNLVVLTAPKLSDMKRGNSLTVTLKSLDRNVPISAQEKSVTVQVLSAQAPEFASTVLSASVPQYVSYSNEVAFVTVADGALSVKRLSGSLPGGLTARVADGKLVIAGIPTRAGSYNATFQAVQKIGGTTVSGGTIDVALTVVALSEAGSIGACLPTKSETHYGVVVELLDEHEGEYAVEPDNFRTLAGMVTLTYTARGTFTISYESRYRKVSMRTAGWSVLSKDGKTLTAEAASGDYAFAIACSDMGAGAAGMRRIATIRDPYFPGKTLLVVFPEVVKGSAAKDFVGAYNVNFTATDTIDAQNPENVPSGDAFIKLSITASGAKSGSVTYAGAVPNGTAVSGSTLLFSLDGGKNVFVPFFNRFSGKTDKHDVFAGAFWLAPGAAATWQHYPTEDQSELGNRVIEGMIPCAWHHVDTGLLEVVGTEAFDRLYETYGGYYDTGVSFEDIICRDIDKTDEYEIVIPVAEFPASAVHGAVVGVSEGGIVRAVGQRFSLVPGTASNGLQFSFNRSTGLFTGRFNLVFDDGFKTSANFKGCVLPAWGTGCGCYDIPTWAVIKAFGLGSVYYADAVEVNVGTVEKPRMRTISVKRGAKIELWPLSAD